MFISPNASHGPHPTLTDWGLVKLLIANHIVIHLLLAATKALTHCILLVKENIWLLVAQLRKIFDNNANNTIELGDCPNKAKLSCAYTPRLIKVLRTCSFFKIKIHSHPLIRSKRLKNPASTMAPTRVVNFLTLVSKKIQPQPAYFNGVVGIGISMSFCTRASRAWIMYRRG